MKLDEYKQEFDKLKKEQRPLVDMFNRSRSKQTKNKLLDEIIVIENKLQELSNNFHNTKTS